MNSQDSEIVCLVISVSPLNQLRLCFHDHLPRDQDLPHITTIRAHTSAEFLCVDEKKVEWLVSSDECTDEDSSVGYSDSENLS
jgi:hypothetical protein